MESNIKKLQAKEGTSSETMSSKESQESQQSAITGKKTNEQIQNLQRALEINEDSKADSKILCDQHKKFMNFESARFHQLMNEIDQIIDKCDM